jgi:hypothetical protein
MFIKPRTCGAIGVVAALVAVCQTGVAVQVQSPDPARAPTTSGRILQFVDLDGDGRVEPAELAVAQQSAATILALDWTESDVDRDGSLNATEFAQAAIKTMQALLADDREAQEPSEQQVQEDLASAVPFSLVLERVAKRPRYADEVAALRKAIEDLSVDEDVVAYVVGHAAQYPRLTPLLQTWMNSYPVRPGLLRYLKPSAQRQPFPVAKPVLPVRQPPAAKWPPPSKAPATADKPPPRRRHVVSPRR